MGRRIFGICCWITVCTIRPAARRRFRRGVSFAEMAAACGYASSLETSDLGRISSWLSERPLDGARFARLFIACGHAR